MKMQSDWSKSAVIVQTCFWVLTAFVAAAQPRLEPLVQEGKWPELTRGTAYDVKVVGNRAYLALGGGGAGYPRRERSGQPGALGRL